MHAKSAAHASGGLKKHGEPSKLKSKPSKEEEEDPHDNPKPAGTKRPSMAQLAEMVGKDPLEAEELKLCNQQLCALPDLSSSKSLKKVDISGNSLATLDAIAGCREITWLNAKENQIEDLGPISRQFKMQVLNIGSNRE